jgi:hypothetical protein
MPDSIVDDTREDGEQPCSRVPDAEVYRKFGGAVSGGGDWEERNDHG